MRQATSLALLVCVACLSNHPVHRLDAGRELPWLVAGQTTRAEIEALLGPADDRHEDGRIRTWWLDSGNRHARIGGSWDKRRAGVLFDEEQRASHVFGMELPWIVVGTTTRAEIELQLGPPGKVYSHGSGCLWWFDGDGHVVPGAPPEDVSYAPRNLVVVFGEGERAQRVSQVQIW